MAKDDKITTSEAGQPVAAEPEPAPAPAAEAGSDTAALTLAEVPAKSQTIRAMNVSTTLLSYHNSEHGPSHPFPPRAVADLTQEEFDRFSSKGLVALA
jgi:hypothetical protein